MPAHKLRSREGHRAKSSPGHERPIGYKAGTSGSTLAEVVTVELAIKRALAPLATGALARGCDLICEVLPEVGEYVLGDRKQFMSVVTQIAAEGVALASGGNVYVRVARQHGGFAPSDTVLVSVSIRRAEQVEDVGCIEVSLPLAERPDGAHDSRQLAATRVLVVVPDKHTARIYESTARRFGALVESVFDASLAHDKMRDATAKGAPFDVLVLDENAPNLADLLRAPQGSSLGSARSILATALVDSPLRRAFATGSSHTLSKPVLPHELCEAIALLREPDERLTEPAPPDEEVEPTSERGAPRRRTSGLRNLRLAEVLASLAVAPARRAR
jgi:CheY-like chemotaxis protein